MSINVIKKYLSILGVPLAIWAASSALFFSAAQHEHFSPQPAETWAHWDSFQYLSIAAEGYKIWREPREGQGRLVEWNGNAAWFPLYPFMARALTHTGMTLGTAARVIAETFWFLTLVVLWNGYFHRRSEGLLPLALAAVFPGAIYFHAIFPTSLTLFLMLVYMQSLLQKRFWAAFIFGLAAGMSYTSAFYLTAAVLAWCWHEKNNLDFFCVPFILAALAPACGPALVFILQHAETGSWNSFFRVWEFHRYNGWSFIRLKQMLYIPTVFHPTELTRDLIIGQSLSVLMAVILFFAFWRPLTSEHKLLLSVVLVFWILPHVSPYRISWYRAEALLLPLVVLLGDVPRLWQLLLLALWTPLAWLMALQFFRGILV